jgi:hypothetical protein
MSFEIHNKEIKDECDSLLNYFRFVRNATKDEQTLLCYDDPWNRGSVVGRKRMK